ncbi:YdcF family protein [Corynebacterium stationis]|uniref:YdcF family protein n=1 Tax=Corynebacterium stationis TaxID=1705 RepID=UPI0009ED976E
MRLKRGPVERRNRMVRIRNTVAFVLPICLLLGLPAWFLIPPRDAPATSDAVLVLAGASDGRHQLGADLVRKGNASNFVISNPGGDGEPIGHSHCAGDKRPESATETWCMNPVPGTTMGEAKTVGSLAQNENWQSLTVVTNRPHTRRVRMTFERCTTLDISVVPIENVDVVRAPIHVAREIAGFIKFWVTAPC